MITDIVKIADCEACEQTKVCRRIDSDWYCVECAAPIIEAAPPGTYDRMITTGQAKLFVDGKEIGFAQGVRGVDVKAMRPIPELVPLTTTFTLKAEWLHIDPKLIEPAPFDITFTPSPEPRAKLTPKARHKALRRLTTLIESTSIEVDSDGVISLRGCKITTRRKLSRREKRALWPAGSRGMTYAELTQRHPL